MLQKKIHENNALIGSNLGISLISPSESNVDYQLGLYLYDVRELAEYGRTAPVIEGNFRIHPPKLLELSYMLFVNHRGQNRIDATTEQNIFGCAVQTIYDTPTINIITLEPSSEQSEETVRLSVINHTFEDKVKIWSAFQSPHRLSVCFNVSPVVLSSHRKDEINRVTEAIVTAKQNTNAPQRK